MRTFGVEEEFLVVDARTFVPVPIGGEIVAAWKNRSRLHPEAGFTLTTELQREQVEVVTNVHGSASALMRTLRDGRRCADTLAQGFGARVVALAASPLPAETHVTASARYESIADDFALVLREQLTCGCHVHVAVDSDDEGVGVLDRIRVWLPVILAISTNSPFWNGQDTRYESYRRQLWTRLPLAGPTPIFGSADAYRRHVEALVATEVVKDRGMLYFDARLSADHPTVEVRVADVCSRIEVTTLIALLIRALVETAAREWKSGVQPPGVTIAQLELAMWQASKSGLYGPLLHPETSRPCDALTVLDALITHLKPVLTDWDELDQVTQLLRAVTHVGTGARVQRAGRLVQPDLADVVKDAVARTHDE